MENKHNDPEWVKYWGLEEYDRYDPFEGEEDQDEAEQDE